MQSKNVKFVEFLILFVILPVSYALPYSPWLKLGSGLFAFAYLVWVLLKVEKNKFKVHKNLPWKTFWRTLWIQLGIIAVITILYVYYTDSSKLFGVMLNKPGLYFFILFIYSFFSVYPQELVYRTFFFQRYEAFFNSKALLVFVNAVIFSLAHFFLKNTLVFILTFIGGILFAITFSKTRSTLMVSIEHAIYGSWLFTVGMGEMLAFPS